MLFEKQNYTIKIGSKIPTNQTVRYIFNGWHDEQKQKDFHTSLSFFASEVYAGRVQPVSNISRAIINITVSTRGFEPPVGTVVDILYNQDQAKIEDIEKFLADAGVVLSRAEPFVKPVKTLGECIKEYFLKIL